MASLTEAYFAEKNDFTGLPSRADSLLPELFEKNPLATIIVDLDGKITALAGSDIPVLAPDMKIGDIMFKNSDSKYRDVMYEEMIQCIKHGKNGENTVETSDKKIISIVMLHIANGAVINTQDITEKVKSRKELLEIKSRYKALFERTLNLIFIHDFKGKFIDANDTALLLLGYTRDDIPSLRVSDIICEEDRAAANAALEEAMMHGMLLNPVEFKLKKKNGEFVWIICETSIIHRDGKPFAIQGIARDITQRKIAETFLSESEEKYRTLFENINTGICRNTGGPHGKFLHANPAMAKMLGYDSVHDLTKIHVSDIYQDPGDRIKFVEKVTKSGTVKWKELQLKKKDGTCITAACTARAAYDENNEVKWIDVLIDDITRQKKAEERLIQSYKDLRKTLTSTVQAIAMAIESRDPYTAGHQRRVAELAYLIAEEMNFSKNNIDGVRLAGLIHDLGKITIPAEILSKPSELTGIEFELIKSHCRIGFDILKSIEFPWPVAKIVYQHHERLDGSGYPLGLSGDDILTESKILAVSDVVEAMATDRPYRAALGIDKALNEIDTKRGILYDSAAVDACISLFNKKGFKFNGV